MSEIEVGRQKGRVVSAKCDVTEKGKPFICVTFALEHGGEMPAYVWLTTAKALSMARGRLRSIGFDIDLANLDDLQKEPCPVAGAEVIVDVQDEEWNGQTTRKIVWFGKERKPLPKSQAMDLTRKLREVKNQIPGDDDVPADDPAPAPAGKGDDQYPF